MSGIDQAYFLRDLTPRELAKVTAVATEARFAKDETIVAVNSKIDHLYVIRSGRVRVVVPVESGETVEEEVLVTMQSGECFGEFSFVDRRPASTSIVADEPTAVFALPYVDLDPLLEADPQLAHKLVRAMLRTVVQRIRTTDADLALARYVLRYV